VRLHTKTFCEQPVIHVPAAPHVGTVVLQPAVRLQLVQLLGDLMRRGFDLDVLACPRCGGRMRLLATIEDPQVIRKILAHLGLPRGPRPQPTPAPSGSRR